MNDDHAAKSDPSLSISFPIYHLPNLIHEKLARNLLERIVQEFSPIISRRQYNVVSISEMCCCGDGLDFQVNNDGKHRRKLRLMSNNIWGYNQSSSWRNGSHRYSSSSHTIHIRLRHPTDHTRLLPYEDVAGTLAHELAHCVHSPHNQHFYKLMDDILDEHANLLASQLRYRGNPIMPFSGSGQTVGSSTAPLSSNGSGQRLGGGRPASSGNKLGGDTTFTQWMTPSEAAVVAAEARRRQQQLRLRGDHCCRPCTVAEDSESETDGVDEIIPALPQNEASNIHCVEGDDKFNGILTQSTNSWENVECIDLTIDDGDEYYSIERSRSTVSVNITDENDIDRKPCYAASKRQRRPMVNQEWICDLCTFRNRNGDICCDMCATKRVKVQS
jgi:DNA-dependent metalloprotease WSS1